MPVGEAVEDELLGDVELPGVDDLPLFANEEAVVLHAEIKKQKAALEKAEKQEAEHAERLQIMDEHLKNVRQEVLHTTSLVASKKKELEAETHLKQLAVREGGRYKQGSRRCRTASRSRTRATATQNAIFKGNEEMDKFKLQMNWNQEELEQWALAAAEGEDNLALQVKAGGKPWSVLLARKCRLDCAPLNRARLNRAPEPVPARRESGAAAAVKITSSTCSSRS